MPIENRRPTGRYFIYLLLLGSIMACQNAEPLETANAVISDDGSRVEYSGVGGETALETLRDLTDVDVRVTSLGEFVTGVAGRSAAGGHQFWMFLVNDQTVRVGAGDYIAKPGDRITWVLKTHTPTPKPKDNVAEQQKDAAQ